MSVDGKQGDYKQLNINHKPPLILLALDPQQQPLFIFFRPGTQLTDVSYKRGNKY